MWWKDAVVYQIYPRSFADSNGDGVGDLRGIVDRLDYLNDGTSNSLGVDAIWLSPFYPSPMADFGYDIADYTGVDSVFGALGDFDLLLGEAHRRGIRVLVDFVPNHTSSQHPWFLESSSSRDSAKRDWYVWRDGTPDGGPPNNWRSFFPRVGPAWTHDPKTGQWYLHSFSPQQPDLNWDNPAVEQSMHQVLQFWLERGVDGFRIDALPLIGKDPVLRDNPDEPATFGAWGRYNIDWPSVHERLRSIRRVVASYGERVLLGEVNVLDIGRLVPYVNGGDELDLVHNFLFTQQSWSATGFRKFVDELEGLLDGQACPAWYLGNHDNSRVASRYGADGRGRRRARLAGMLLLTLRGTPFVYQGEELGLADAIVPPWQVVDVDGRDPARAPVPWEPPSLAGPSAGFTNGTPWLPLPSDLERVNVARQRASGATIWSSYRRLILCRREHLALRSGTYRSLETGEPFFAYVREAEGEQLLVILNFAASRECFAGRGLLRDQSARLIFSTEPDRPQEPIQLSTMTLEPEEGVIVALT